MSVSLKHTHTDTVSTHIQTNTPIHTPTHTPTHTHPRTAMHSPTPIASPVTVWCVRPGSAWSRRSTRGSAS